MLAGWLPATTVHHHSPCGKVWSPVPPGQPGGTSGDGTSAGRRARSSTCGQPTSPFPPTPCPYSLPFYPPHTPPRVPSSSCRGRIGGTSCWLDGGNRVDQELPQAYHSGQGVQAGGSTAQVGQQAAQAATKGRQHPTRPLEGDPSHRCPHSLSSPLASQAYSQLGTTMPTPPPGFTMSR